MTPLFLQAPSGQGSQSSTGELKCGHGVPGPSLMEQFTVLAEITPELLCCPVQIPAPFLRRFPRLQGSHNRHSTQTGWELSPQPTPGALHTHLPSSRSLRGPYLSMTIPKGSVMALSRKEPMVKAKSPWLLCVISGGNTAPSFLPPFYPSSSTVTSFSLALPSALNHPPSFVSTANKPCSTYLPSGTSRNSGTDI
uniref:Uncharacterized protein n=1 Tax=Cyanistes caeruleus TaxID=156563 RepID=A0A8C0ZAI5_CYACU